MTTREIILKTAKDLFNQSGTARVSTNHIASAAGVSPGNLYYYFRDKEHIIRELYEGMVKEWEAPYEHIEKQIISFTALEQFTKEHFMYLWEYRYFYREAVALLQADEELAKRHAEVTHLRLERQRAILGEAAAAGALRFPSPEVEMDDVLTIAWIVSTNYLNYLESLGREVGKEDFDQGAALVVKIFYPYQV